MNTAEEVYEIAYDEDQQAVVMTWQGYATSEQFREGTELMLNMLVQHQVGKVLADIRKMVLIGQDDQQWLEHNFVPRAIQAGFQALAIIKPTSYFNKVAVESVSYKVAKDKLTISFFDDAADAKRWLRSCRKPA